MNLRVFKSMIKRLPESQVVNLKDILEEELNLRESNKERTKRF